MQKKKQNRNKSFIGPDVCIYNDENTLETTKKK